MKKTNPILDTLVDIRNIAIDTSKPIDERRKEYIKLIKNPNQFRVGNIVVNINNVTTHDIDDRLTSYILRELQA